MTINRRSSFKPRKLPRQSRAEHTVAAILEAAALILEARGLDGLNTNAVAEWAGVSIGSLYQYFPGKDALIVALCQRERALFLAEAEGALSEPTGRQAFKRLITASVRQQLYRPVLARLLDLEESRTPIAHELAPFMVGMTELIRQLLGRADIPPQPSIETATDELIAIVRGMVNAAGDRGEADCAALEARVSRALFGYLGIDGLPGGAAEPAAKRLRGGKRASPPATQPASLAP